ncbi:sulfatase-like hydrolase/transferase [Ruegeria sp. HKCCA5763]|uniref:sulfatase-like hydrolase/transferase n=1 Tax=Ruegeria sp. HKCCA5763 TaxID=2682987 RepID=UPI0014885088|nr:sulfatase-like hydrolase/transferase [Ruegeria sp. HKCCA5763]
MNVRPTALFHRTRSFVAALVTAFAIGAPAHADDRPNVLLILADDATISDFGFAGSPIQTPNIDALVEAGTLFTRFHAAPVCSVSRSMVLTGNDPVDVGLATFDYAVYPETKGVEGYETYLTRRGVAVQELLQDSGYMTMMVGKWHLGGKAAGGQGPHEWGFDRSYAILGGGSNHWNDNISILNQLDPKHVEAAEKGEIPKEKYYENGVQVDRPTGVYSDGLWTARILEYMSEAQAADKPFFAYVAYTTPHAPLQAPKSLVAKHAEYYLEQGYEGLRKKRWEQQQANGIIPEGAPLPPWGANPLVSNWDDLDDEQKRRKALYMSTYAAMIESQDQHVGAILDFLRETGELDNTLIIYMSDNGPEGQDTEGPLSNEGLAAWFDSVSNPDPEAIGDGDVYAFTGTNWSHAQAGALGWYKWFVSEGGVRVPVVIVPPKNMEFAREGVRTSEFANVKDLPATILDLAGVSSPSDTYKGREIIPASGISLRPYLSGETDSTHNKDDHYVFELFGNGYVVQGNLKALRVRKGMWGDGE